MPIICHVEWTFFLQKKTKKLKKILERTCVNDTKNLQFLGVSLEKHAMMTAKL